MPFSKKLDGWRVCLEKLVGFPIPGCYEGAGGYGGYIPELKGLYSLPFSWGQGGLRHFEEL
jgi:hypothetical protein